MTPLYWAAVLTLNGFVAVYGGAWLGKWLIAAPKIGAAAGVVNLAVALITRVKEQPTLAQRVMALKHNRSAHSSVTGLLLLFFAAECLAFAIVKGALRWLEQGGGSWMSPY